MGPPVPKDILQKRKEKREVTKVKVFFDREKALNDEISTEIRSNMKSIKDRFE